MRRLQLVLEVGPEPAGARHHPVAETPALDVIAGKRRFEHPIGRGDGIGQACRIERRLGHAGADLGPRDESRIAATDLIATVPERIAIKFANQCDVRVLRPPLAIAPITISAYWRERTHNEPAHRWFRKALSQIAAEL